MRRDVTLSLSRCVTLSLSRCVTLSLSRLVTLSLSKGAVPSATASFDKLRMTFDKLRMTFDKLRMTFDKLGMTLIVVLLAGCAHHADQTNAPAPRASSMMAAVGATPTPVPLHVVSSGEGRFTTLTEMKRGRRLYTIRAASFVADATAGASASGNGEFDAPQITFVDRAGAATIASAPKAVLTGADKSVVMTGGVRARSQDGNVLHCDRLRYDGQTERVHGDGNVRMQTPSGLTLVGDTIDGDARLANVLVRKHG